MMRLPHSPLSQHRRFPLTTFPSPTSWASSALRIRQTGSWVSLLPELEETLIDFLRAKASGSPLSRGGLLFFAGWPDAEGSAAFMPNVNLVVESLPREMAVTDYLATSEQNASDLITGFKVSSRAYVLTENGESAISETEYDISNLTPVAQGKIYNINLVTLGGRVAWVVTCTLSAATMPSQEDLQTCNTVVRSFRILE